MWKIFSWRKPTRTIRRPSVRRRLEVEVLEDRLMPAGGIVPTFAVTQDWGTGFQANLTLTNSQTASVSNWQLAFDYSPTITSIWNAQIVSHTGSHYVIAGDSWDSSLPANGSVSFGFNGSAGSANTVPANYLLDGVSLSTSPPPLPGLSLTNATVTEPASGGTTVSVPVTLSAASTTPVTVHYATADATAHAGVDYQAATGTLTFAPGQTQQTIQVAINNNSTTQAEITDTNFNVDLSNASGATLSTSAVVVTIHHPAPPPPPAGNVQFQDTSDWGSGFNGQITINNNGTQPVTNWTLTFNFAPAISSIWNASIVSHTGTQYVIAAASWNSTIPVDGSVSFGFSASPGNLTTAMWPTNYSVNGTKVVVPPPVAGNVTASTIQNQAVSVPVLSAATDPNGYTLTLASVGAAQHGTVVANANGSVTYTPAAGFIGSDSFTYTVSDGHGNSATGTVAMTVTAIPPPVAGNGSASTLVNQAVTIAVLANATDAAGYTLTVTAVGAAQHGTAVKNADGTVTYTPASGYVGSDSFTYTVSDGHGGTATGSIAVTVSTTATSGWPAQVFAPYVDATDWPIYNFLQVAQTQGTKFFNLGFVVAGPNDEPAWGGYQAYDVVGSSYSANLQAEIAALRQIGGDVAVSFGGAANQELAEVIPTVSALQAAYQTVINTYNLTHIDFDIEGAAQDDQVAIDRRSQAIAGLELAAAAAGRQLVVSFTLPVLPTGLTAEGLNVLTSALKYGVTVNLVNIMAMDYGDGAAPNPAGQMGTYAIDAANSLFTQLTAVYGTQKTSAQIWGMIGVTVMIGVNDISDEIFTQSNAQQLLVFAQQKGLGEISMWSLNRDQPGASAYDVSGVNVGSFDFSNIFETYSK